MGLRKRKVRAVERGSKLRHLPARCDIQISDHGDRVLSFRGDLRKGLKSFVTTGTVNPCALLAIS